MLLLGISERSSGSTSPRSQQSNLERSNTRKSTRTSNRALLAERIQELCREECMGTNRSALASGETRKMTAKTPKSDKSPVSSATLGGSSMAGTSTRFIRDVDEDEHDNERPWNRRVRTDELLKRGSVPWLRSQVGRIVSSSAFDAAIGLFLVLNSVTIGVEQTYRIQEDAENIPSIVEVSENIFLTIYMIELFLRFFAFGAACVQDNWVKFDILLVGVSVTYGWILKPFSTGVDSESGGMLVILRIVRLARLARTIRLLIKFRVLWMLVRGLLSSAETMLYTLIVLLIMLYVFATIGVELITIKSKSGIEDTDAGREFEEMVEKYFSSLPDVMLTLMQFACLDSIGNIYRPMIQYDITLAAYFMAIILIIPIVLMNLVTAIIVNSAMEQALSDKAAVRAAMNEKQQRLMRKVGQLFHDIDEDNSGKVSREEMGQMRPEEREALCDLCGIEEDPLTIFDSLDVDGSGELDIDEFCAGIWKAATAKSPMEMQRMVKQITVILERQRENERRHQDVLHWMRDMQSGMLRMQEALSCLSKPAVRFSMIRTNAESDLDNLAGQKMSVEKHPLGDAADPLQASPIDPLAEALDSKTAPGGTEDSVATERELLLRRQLAAAQATVAALKRAQRLPSEERRRAASPVTVRGEAKPTRAVMSARRLAASLDGEEFVEVARSACQPVCPAGHPLVELGLSKANGWGCNGQHDPMGCRSGITGVHQCDHLNRFQCVQCDYDLCEPCVRAAFELPTPAGSESTALAPDGDPSRQDSVGSSTAWPEAQDTDYQAVPARCHARQRVEL